jgi:hypothetical protein
MSRRYGHVSSGRFTTIGLEVLLTTTQRKGAESEGLISMCGTKPGTWMKIAGFGARPIFAHRPPANFTDSRQDVGDCLLFAMMVDARPSPRFDLKQSAPQR